MQSTGHSAMQSSSLVQVSVITYAIVFSLIQAYIECLCTSYAMPKAQEIREPAGAQRSSWVRLRKASRHLTPNRGNSAAAFSNTEYGTCVEKCTTAFSRVTCMPS